MTKNFKQKCKEIKINKTLILLIDHIFHSTFTFTLTLKFITQNY